MKKLAIIIFSLGVFISLNSYAQQMPAWDLARDLQISFTQGANGVWYFMESEFSGVHDPAVYRLLPKYLAPCRGQGKVFAGVGCWQGTEARIPDCFQLGCGLKTEVAFNFGKKNVPYEDFLAGYAPHIPHLLANWDRDVIVAWQSPLAGTINVSASFIYQNGLSIGVDWSVDKGNQILKSGHIYIYDDGQVRISQLPVVKGDVLYFIVHDAFPNAFQANPLLFLATISKAQ